MCIETTLEFHGRASSSKVVVVSKAAVVSGQLCSLRARSETVVAVAIAEA